MAKERKEEWAETPTTVKIPTITYQSRYLRAKPNARRNG
jgi:hypothetical protein